MNEEAPEQIFLSRELLDVMRDSARIALECREPFITVRSLLLALLNDPHTGPALAGTISREKLDAYEAAGDAIARMTASRVPEPHMPPGERPAMLRFNTLAFKVPDGSRSVWLSREALSAFAEGARRVDEGALYAPKHLAFGVAADAIRAPGLLSALHIEPGAVTDAVTKANA
ncbi:MAG TPA: hypothetical protein VGN11_03795 [Candidatus Baltobacteraceae bacterium]|jgi:hypothetical protein|nr:hypothetical protein [Candidatus Baltobacteraceae bacterium]